MCLAFAFCFFFFFFFSRFSAFRDKFYCSRTVHGTHNHFIQKKILKMGPTALFTRLKIILVMYMWNFNSFLLSFFLLLYLVVILMIVYIKIPYNLVKVFCGKYPSLAKLLEFQVVTCHKVWFVQF